VALSKVQVGLIGQMEFIKLGTLGSKGALDYASPYADDDRRDHEIHRRGRLGLTLSVQTKIMRTLRTVGKGAAHLHLAFFIAIDRLVSSRRFWYFFAHLDRKTMRFSDPCFLVPSVVVHRHCLVGRSGDILEFTFDASMAPDSNDRWVRYRVTNAEIGTKLLEVVNGLDRTGFTAAQSRLVAGIEGAIVVRRREGRAP
jgi:hypothetical protein